MSGKDFNLNDDDLILKINSPQSSVGGPYKVVYKDLVERWVIVAFDWDNRPSLGIRWFWDSKGNPLSTGYPIWFVIPSSLYKSTLDGLPLAYSARIELEKFLMGEIEGTRLSK